MYSSVSCICSCCFIYARSCASIFCDFTFKNCEYENLRFPIAEGKEAGLRNAQIGAIHAVASYATLNSKDSAVIVMPTGSGKTTVVMMAPYILKKAKVLIVTPSAMVRGQIANDYASLRTLKYVGVFSKDTNAPNIYEAKHLYRIEVDDEILNADVVVATHQVAASISDAQIKNVFDYIIIDEAQFMKTKQAETFAYIVDYYNIPVICYGLKTDFKGELFEGSRRLIELCDVIEEIPTVCWCGCKAKFNARISEGKVLRDGEQVQLGGNESYVGLCRKHYMEGVLSEENRNNR